MKLTDFASGACIKSLQGHKRTPWVVNFNPARPNIVVSGSLDREVRLWDAVTGECLQIFAFSRPIASISFHAGGGLMAIATGHKLYIWRCSGRGAVGSRGAAGGEPSAVHAKPEAPAMVLRTQRSLRAVQFHPCGAPYLLTAELNQVISEGQKELIEQLPPPMAADDDEGAAASPFGRPAGHDARRLLLRREAERAAEEAARRPSAAEAARAARAAPDQGRGGPELHARRGSWPTHLGPGEWEGLRYGGGGPGARPPTNPIAIPSHDIMTMMEERTDGGLGALVGTVASAATYASRTGSRVTVQTDGRLRPSSHLGELRASPDSRANPTTTAAVAAMAAATAAATFSDTTDPPCCVKLKVWPFAESSARQLLEAEQPVLTLPNVVLCSEMGAHFSPCGRFLVVAVVCHTPLEADSVLQDMMMDAGDWGEEEEGDGADGCRTGKISYELRVLSAEPATFGEVLMAKRLVAAHCLTAIQFSPTSQHVLVSYGRRHMALLESLVAERNSVTPMHTVIEVYALPSLGLVETYASAEDEVNVAIFHPVPGHGVAYGTKEGRLQRVCADRRQMADPAVAASKFAQDA